MVSLGLRRRRSAASSERVASLGAEEGSARRAGRGAAARVAVVAAVAVLSTGAMTSSAAAADGVTTSGSPNVRQAPSATSTWLGSIPSGTPVKVSCQTSGQTINGSSVWDRIAGYGYVSDVFLNGTPYAQFDSRFARCSPGQAPYTDRSVDLDQACRYSWNRPDLWAFSFQPTSPYNTTCVVIGLSALGGGIGGVDMQKYCTITQEHSRAVVVSQSMWGWRCRY